MIKRSHTTVIHALGLMLMLFSGAYIFPLILAMLEEDTPMVIDFLAAMLITLSAGSAMCAYHYT